MNIDSRVYQPGSYRLSAASLGQETQKDPQENLEGACRCQEKEDDSQRLLRPQSYFLVRRGQGDGGGRNRKMGSGEGKCSASNIYFTKV